MRTRRRSSHETILITEAPLSMDDQQASRRRKYAVMMTIRVVCLFAAAAIAQWSIVIALLLLLGGAVLPWCAVLIANDRPPKRAERVARYRGDGPERALSAGAADQPSPSERTVPEAASPDPAADPDPRPDPSPDPSPGPRPVVPRVIEG